MATPNKLHPNRDEILAKFDRGSSVKELCQMYDVTEPSMRSFLKKNGRKPRGRTDLKQCNNLSVADAAYIAGLIDGDGCLTASVGKSRNSVVVNYKLIVSMCDELTIKWLQEITSVGTITRTSRINQPKWKDLHRFECSGQQLNSMLEEVIPYLKLKKPQSLLLQELGSLKKNKLGWGVDRNIERQIEISQLIQKMNFRGVKQDEAL
ncbi:MAG: hypothetical protein U7127_07325 [Phormidium sp.]